MARTYNTQPGMGNPNTDPKSIAAGGQGSNRSAKPPSSNQRASDDNADLVPIGSKAKFRGQPTSG